MSILVGVEAVVQCSRKAVGSTSISPSHPHNLHRKENSIAVWRPSSIALGNDSKSYVIFYNLYKQTKGQFIGLRPLSTYSAGRKGSHPKCMQLHTRGADVMPHVYVCTYTVFFHVFDSMLVLWCLVLFVEI